MSKTTQMTGRLIRTPDSHAKAQARGAARSRPTMARALPLQASSAGEDESPPSAIAADALPDATQPDTTTEAERVDDIDFVAYRLLNKDLAELAEPALRAHWKEFGHLEGRAYDLNSYLKANPDIANRMPADFSVSAYRQFNPDLRSFFKADLEYTLHFLHHGFAENRPFATSSAERNSGALATLANAQPDSKLHAELRTMLKAAGIVSDRFLALFNTAEYLVRNKHLGVNNEAACLPHFLEHGRASLEPIALDYAFDPVFYAEIEPDTAGMAPEDAYLSWLNKGIARGSAPNKRIFLRELGLTNLAGLPAGFNPAAYAAANPDTVPAADPWSALRHMLEKGIAQQLRGCEPREDFTDLYLAAADSSTLRGELDCARQIYERALTVAPTHAPTLQHYGDCQMRRSEYFAASFAYRRIIEAEADNIWTHRNLAESLLKQKDELGASRVLSQLSRKIPGDENIRRQAEDAAAEAFASLSSEASWLAEHRFYDEARLRMSEAVDILLHHYATLQPATALRAPRAVRNVLLIGETCLPQCNFYRIQQKLEHLKAAGLACIFIAHDALDRIDQYLAYHDVVIFYRLPATPKVVRAISAARRAGLPTFYDIDDPIYDSERFPDSFESYAGQIDRKVYGGLVTGTTLFQAAMRLCDYGIASTPTLQEDMANYVRGRQVFLHRNAFSALHEKAAAYAVQRASIQSTAPSAQIKIFYGSGTRAHNEDFDTLAAPALARILKEFGTGVELTIMGYLTVPPVLEPYLSQIRTYEPIFNPEIYWRVLSEMDINIAVLKPGFVADAKSEIKWLEAAMLGVPSVVSDTRTYRDILDDGVNGLIATSPKSWYAQLKRLVRDTDLRKRIGHAARELAQQKYSVTASAANLVHLFGAVSPPAETAPKLKLLIVNVFFPPQAIGGATRVVADNVRELRELAGDALDIEVLTTTEGGGKPYDITAYRWDGVKIVAVTAANTSDVDYNPFDERMAETFDRFLAYSQPDLIHFHCVQRLSASVCAAAAARKIPHVITAHDGWWISDNQFLLDKSLSLSLYSYEDRGRQLAEHGPISYNRMQELFRHLAAADRVLAVSPSFAKVLACTGLPNIATLENGVSELLPLPKHPDPDGCVRVLYAGGMEPHKGYPLVKAAFHGTSFGHLKLTVIDHGLGPGASRTDSWGTTPVRFIGKTPQVKVAELYAGHDVLIAPSLWPESYGLVTREAALCGCWVIASDRGAMAADITPETGFVINVDSPDPLRSVLGQIDAEPETYARPASVTTKPLRTSRDQAAELLALYHEVIASRKNDAQFPDQWSRQ